LERRTAAPWETRRHLPPNRAEYTQPNGDHPGHIAAELYAKRDTSTRRADITEDKARTGRVDRWIDGTRPERASTLATFCHLAYQQCFPGRGSGVAECGASAVDGGNASHSARFSRNRTVAVQLVCRRRATLPAPQPPAGPRQSPAA
jgi:hypothetical protein